jgi:hypothetical protein
VQLAFLVPAAEVQPILTGGAAADWREHGKMERR